VKAGIFWPGARHPQNGLAVKSAGEFLRLRGLYVRSGKTLYIRSCLTGLLYYVNKYKLPYRQSGGGVEYIYTNSD
jgi:hypothetical protein